MLRSVQRCVLALLTVAAIGLFPGDAQAGRRHLHNGGWSAGCGPVGCDCGPSPAGDFACEPRVVTETIMVPHVDYKTMTVRDVVCKPEVRQRTIQVTRMVSETTMVSRPYTVMVPVQRVRTEHYTVCRLEYEEIADSETIAVPYTEMRQGVRTVCQPVLATEYMAVCRDAGYCDTRSYTDCDGCVKTYQVWVPNVVEEQVPVQVMRPQMVEVPYEYPVTLCRPETRHFTRTAARPRYENRTRDVAYTVAVPQMRERQVPHTTSRPVVEERVVSYTEMVPHTVERTVTVPVCTLVPRQVSYTVGCDGAR
ncbi:MAG: hypothetical protein WD872_05355 [Pirellulaceae bacterium]